MARWAIGAAIALAVMGGLSFLSAGTLAWPMGWLFLGAMAAIPVLMLSWVGRRNPALLARRSAEDGAGAMRWEKLLVPLVSLAPMAMAVVAGLHWRFGWPGQIGLGWGLAALGPVLAASAFVCWAMAENPFFSRTVRLQPELGHGVVAGGPYRFVRHPGYFGSLIANLGFPVLLGSAWACLPMVVGLAALVVRTRLEDAMLVKSLPGYAAYAAEVRHRLIPGLW